MFGFSNTGFLTLFSSVLIGLMCTVCSAQSTPEIDSLESRLKTVSNSAEKVNLLAALCRDLSRIDPVKASKYGKQGLKLAQSINDEEGVATCLNNIANVHYTLGEHDKALKRYLEALAIEEKNNNKKGIRNLYGNIGNIYRTQKQYGKALEHYQKSMGIAQELNDEGGIAKALTGMGIVAKAQGDFNKALDYYLQSSAIAEKLGNQKQNAMILGNIGNVYYDLPNLEKAIEYHQMSLDIKHRLNDKKGIARTNNNMARVYHKMGDFETATAYNLKSKAIAEELGIKGILDLVYQDLTDNYAAQNQYDKAYEFHQLYVQMHDSILNENMSKQLIEMETRYEFNKKEQEIALLNKKQELRDEELQRSKLINYFITAGGILLLVLIAFMIFYFRRKARSQQLLAEKDLEIAAQKQQELISLQKVESMKAIVNAQEIERKRIAQEIHDGTSSDLAAVKLNLLNIEGNEKVDQQVNKAVTNLNTVLEELRNISHNLIPPVFFNIDLCEALNSYIEQISSGHQLEIKFKRYPEEQLNQLDEETRLTIYRIIQELLNNATKHANATAIEVHLVRHTDHVNLIVEDNGTGFDEADVKQGIGLKNITSRVQIMEGELHIDSSMGRGTIVSIDLPVDEQPDSQKMSS
jgi:two-component system NarL family sensor kinase